MAFDARLLVGLTATYTSALDLTTASAPVNYQRQFTLSEGAGLNAANKIWSDNRTIAASGTDDLDVAGVLTDPFGASITLARIKGIFVFASSANSNNVVVGAGTNPITTIMGGTTPTIIVRPGGMLALWAPDATAYTVTAATADILRIANSGAGTSVNYDIVLIGASS